MYIEIAIYNKNDGWNWFAQGGRAELKPVFLLIWIYFLGALSISKKSIKKEV